LKFLLCFVSLSASVTKRAVKCERQTCLTCWFCHSQTQTKLTLSLSLFLSSLSVSPQQKNHCCQWCSKRAVRVSVNSIRKGDKTQKKFYKVSAYTYTLSRWSFCSIE
jgi:hypothetical protein